MFFDLLLIFLILFCKNCCCFTGTIGRNESKFIKMADLSDFKIVGARMAGASVTKTAESFGVAKSTVSKVMTAF